MQSCAVQCSPHSVCIQVGAVFIACRYSTLSVAMATGEVICQQNVLNCLPLVIPNDNERDINTWQWHIQLSTWPVPRPGQAATLSSVCDMKQTRRVSESSLEMSQLSKNKTNQSWRQYWQLITDDVNTFRWFYIIDASNFGLLMWCHTSTFRE